jgi:hypothetical protein
MSVFKTNSALFRQCHWSFSMGTNEEADQAKGLTVRLYKMGQQKGEIMAVKLDRVTQSGG